MTERSKAIAAIARVARQYKLSYAQFIEICKEVRKELELVRGKKGKVLPKLLTEAQLGKLYEAVDKAEVLTHQIMLRLLFFTAIRVSELIRLEMGDVDLQGCRLFINQGKGSKDRYVLFKDDFRLALSAHMKTQPDSLYLFESRYRKAYTPRGVEKMLKRYAVAAGITERVYPHLLRHQMLTHLTQSGLTDAQIQLISGHSSKRSLEVYQHLGLEAVEKDYQKAVGGLEI